MEIDGDDEQIAPPPTSMSPTANEKKEPSPPSSTAKIAMVANMCVKNEPGGDDEEELIDAKVALVDERFDDETENIPAMNSR